MVQGYPAPCGGGCGRWPSLTHGRGKAGGGSSAIQGNSREARAYPVGLAHKQRTPFTSGEFKLRGLEAPRGEAGGAMLSVSGPEKFYYLRNFHDLRCKYARVLSVIRQQMNREPRAGEAYIMMSKDRHTVRLYGYGKRSCRLYEQRFDKDYTFMKVSCEDDREVFSISWDDVVVLLGSPVVKTLRIK